MSEWTDVAAAADFLPGSRRQLDVDGVAMVVFNVAGHFYAIEDLCSHEAETLSGGQLCGLEITCPAHAARFSLVDGAALSPPAYEPIPVFPVRIENGRVQVRDDRFD